MRFPTKGEERLRKYTAMLDEEQNIEKPCPPHVTEAIRHIAGGGPLCRRLAQALKERAITEGYDARAIVVDEDCDS